MKIFHAETDAELTRCFPVMVQLRSHLTSDEFITRVRRQTNQCYRLAALEAGGAVRSLAGYRLMDVLWAGRILYLDDLITDSASRSQGHGEALFAWLRELALAEGCAELHLDSGLHRRAAHRFYFRQRMLIDDFHFVLKLAPAPA